VNYTWALFRWIDGKWQFAGLTPHDERASEFEEECEMRGLPCQVVSLEDPEAEPPEEVDVDVKGDLL
jgi:hypothetical protein